MSDWLRRLMLRVDPWDPSYGASMEFAGFEEEAQAQVKLDVEVASEDWQPITPAHVAEPEHLYFVDGVRRIEARVVAPQGQSVLYGGFGTYGVGAVHLQAGQKATILKTRIERIIALSNGVAEHGPLAVHPAAIYLPRTSSHDGPDAPVKILQQEMRRAENTLAMELISPNTLVIADGPLHGESPTPGLIGYIKRIHEPYLQALQAPILTQLQTGTRSPLFTIAGFRFTRYSWYIKLADSPPGLTPYSGVVRLEVADTVGIEKAKELADVTATLMPRYASLRSRDPRAPQNLTPIGALENKLRRELGDAVLLKRLIESYVARVQMEKD